MISGWVFKGGDLECSGDIVVCTEFTERRVEVWFKDEDLCEEEPIFCFDGDTKFHFRGSDLVIVDYGDGSLRLSTKGSDVDDITEVLYIDERGIRLVSEYSAQKFNDFDVRYEPHYEETVVYEDGWEVYLVTRITCKQRSFLSPHELPEYWKRVFFHIHRRKVVKKPEE